MESMRLIRGWRWALDRRRWLPTSRPYSARCNARECATPELPLESCTRVYRGCRVRHRRDHRPALVNFGILASHTRPHVVLRLDLTVIISCRQTQVQRTAVIMNSIARKLSEEIGDIFTQSRTAHGRGSLMRYCAAAENWRSSPAPA